MSSERERWDARYRAGKHARGEPDPFALEALAHIERERAPGTALDLACGAGRHALELARRSWQTGAWDVSGAGLELCAQRARAAGVSLRMRQIDLAAPIAGAANDACDLAVVVDFWERALLDTLAQLVRPGGWLIYATFAPDWPGDKPSACFRIATAELLRQLPGFEPLAGLAPRSGRAQLLARRA